MIVAITDYINILTAYSLLVTGLIIAIRAPKTQSKWATLFFIICVVLYLIIEYVPSGVLFYILVAGPLLIPFSFWLLSRSLFSDSTFTKTRILSYSAGVLSFYYLLYYLSESESCQCSQITALLSRSVSLLFVVLAIFEAQRGRTVDLVDKRRKFRSLFTYTVSILVLLTLLAELGLPNAEQEIPKLLQRTTILGFSLYFIIKNATWKDAFLGSPVKKIAVEDPELLDRIHSQMSDEGLFRKEGLTIGQLAEELKEQPYKIRQAINQQMGYRNFTDFINSFRIQEAKKIFSDPTQKKVTVLEVAYGVGFNSIGPFNRAFKLVTGITPTEYRKSINPF